MKKFTWIIVFCTLVICFAACRDSCASQQDDVNYIIGRIRSTLFNSLDNPGWQAKYDLASKNIDDLKKTLQLGGKITSNPVKEYNKLLAQLLEERREEWDAYCKAQEKLEKLRKKQAKQTVNDVGMEMISRLSSPKPGLLSPIQQARTKNAAVIKEDFAKLKTYEDGIKLLDDYKNNLRPAIHDVRDRKHALAPLLAKYNALTPAGFDGSYVGSFTGQAGGAIKFTVKGTSVTGTMSGSYQTDPLSGSFSGTIDEVGNIRTTLSGSLTDTSSMKLGEFTFTGAITGKITGTIGSGSWNAKNNYGNPTGTWSVSKK